MPDAVRAYVALGSNLGDRLRHLQAARQALRVTAGITNLVASPVYDTAPVSTVQQASYLNQVVAFDTTLAPMALLKTLQQIEQQEARQRVVRWGPRTLDLDLLYYGNAHLNSAHLTIPHPQIAARRFVLVPLLAVADPALLPQVVAMLQRAPDTGWVRVYQ